MVIGIKQSRDDICITFLQMSKEEYVTYGFKVLELDDRYLDCQPCDFDVETLEFNVDKYNTRKQSEISSRYEELIIEKIRERYTIDQELAILRQRDTKPEEFAEYNTYVENCKSQSKEELNDVNRS